MALTRFVVVKSNHNKKYLRYIKEDGDEKAPAGFLKFSGEEAGSHYTKYEVEMAKSSGNKGLVHIRCCYNNKYWVSLSGTDKFDNEVLIVAGADKPEEDQSKPSCTLFEPIYVDPIDEDDDNSAENIDQDDEDDNGDQDDKGDQPDLDEDSQVVQFRHVHLGRYTTLHNDSNALVLSAGSNSAPEGLADDPCNVESWDVCTVLNWESLVILPKYVAFKSDEDRYLAAKMIDGEGPYLIFDGIDINDPVVENEILTNADGTLQIKNDFFERYWRRGKDEWIFADAFNPTARDRNYKDTLYRAVKIYDGDIALVSMGNNNYCKKLTDWDKIYNGLSAELPNILIKSRLKVEEPIKSRTICNINYRLNQARTYNYQTDLELATGEAVNFTQETTSLCLKLIYKKVNNRGWHDINRVYSMKLRTNIEAQGVPCIAKHENASVKVDISGGEFKGEVQWGETETFETAVETKYMVSVPASSVVKVRLLASTATCDVPFSYSRRDTRLSGQVQVTTDLDDGFYNFNNAFNFKYDTKVEKLC